MSEMTGSSLIERKDFSKIPRHLDIPDLIEIQKRSYDESWYGTAPSGNTEIITPASPSSLQRCTSATARPTSSSDTIPIARERSGAARQNSAAQSL